MSTSSNQKLDEGRAKLDQAFALAHPALQLGGLAATDPRLSFAAVKAGVRVLEPNHTSIACARALRGLTTMRDAYPHKHEVPFAAVLDVIAGLRRAIPPHVFILSAAPGTFDETEPRLSQREADLLSEAGADAIFLEKNDYREIERLVQMAHAAGLLVQAGFQLQSPGRVTSVVPVRSAVEARASARRLAGLGVDIVGMRLSGIFKSLSAGEVAHEELDCLRALVGEVAGATVVYAGVNAANLGAIAKTKVKMVGVASAVDDLVYRGLAEAIGQYQLPQGGAADAYAAE